MKKLFSMVSVLLLVLVLAGCSEIDSYKEDLDLKIARIEELETELSTLQETLDLSEDEVDSLKEEIILLQGQIYDNVLTFTFLDEHDGFSFKTAGYNDDYAGTLFDILELNFTMDYNETDYGNYIIGIEGLSPKVGAYIAFLKNGEMAATGVDTATFEDGDIFGFQVVWFDALQEAVDDAIWLFLQNQASNYVSDEQVDYSVVSALNLLGITNEYVTTEEVLAILDVTTLTTVNDYFKAIIMMQSVGLDTDVLTASLLEIVAVGPYGQTAYGLITLDSTNHTLDYSDYVTNALADFEANTPYDLGIDAGAISILALSNYVSDPGVMDLIGDYLDWISENQLDSGGVLPRDIVWGETTYPGIENAASISQLIQAIVSLGLDPTSLEYTKDGNNLITRLIEFQTYNGAFYWAIDDELEDGFFSTPQAFLALVAYQTYVNTSEAVNPYDYK